MSRRDQIRMTQDEIRDYLRGSRTIILTSIGPKGFPHPMPMWFAADDDGTIRMTTFRKSQKVRNLERDSRVSLLAESGEEYAELKGVLIYGRAELVDDMDTIVSTLQEAAGGPAPPAGPEAREAIAAVIRATAAKRICIRVVPDEIVSWDHGKLGGTY